MRGEGYRPGDLGDGDLLGLYAAAVAGGEFLALELERHRLSGEDDSALDAMRLRPELLREVERRRVEARAPEVVGRLQAAAIVGEEELAGELEELGLAGETEALRVARRVRPRLLEKTEPDEKEEA